MDANIVRITNISLQHFKNISMGEVSLQNRNDINSCSILGIYGQNGSGKTALIEGINILKCILCGKGLDKKYIDFIQRDEKEAYLSFDFQIQNNKSVYEIKYQFTIGTIFIKEQNVESIDEGKYIPIIKDEKLSIGSKSNNERLLPVIDVSKNKTFGPNSKRNILVGNTTKEIDLLVIKKQTNFESRSFIFSRELLSIIRANCSDSSLLEIIESLVNYANYCLFVIDTKNSGLISLNAALPLSFKIRNDVNKISLGNMALSINKEMAIPQYQIEVVEKIINNMNIVLQQIIPHITIKVVKLGPAILANGEKNGAIIALYSVRDGKEIPIKYESEGIKKIISVLQLLIVVYNNSSITVAIDELDAGIFEYLLGEILKIFSNSGKGQLIFTSHNLRPLETIDKKFIVFTTTNPYNRFIKLANIKNNNNLRDTYYRDIITNRQKEKLYDSTNNYEIAFAFKEAGENGI